ncbi:MAG TPA: hypothetical protein VFS05_15390 [Gemmatimonadaceae bacterium]|nr:hypothetical protein [Gemmatimonadaceae bacterium]
MRFAHGAGARRGRAPAAAAAAGGALIAGGAALPWLSLFAGLQTYSGLIGGYGRLLFAGGMIAIAGGIAAAARPARWIRPTVGALGVLLALFTSWLLVGLAATIEELATHPLVIARAGPGLYVSLAGALIVTLSALPLGFRRE